MLRHPERTAAGRWLLSLFVAACFLPASGARGSNPDSLSPVALVTAPDEKTLYIACAKGSRVLSFDVAAGKVARSMEVLPNPTGLCIAADGRRIFVTCAGAANCICVLDTLEGKVVGKLPGGHGAMAPVLSADERSLFVCNRFDNEIGVLDVMTGLEVRRIPVRREPVAAAITTDGKRLLVANHLQAGRSDKGHVAAVISVIDTARGQVVDDLWMPAGSGLLNDVRVSPDGGYAVATHLLARFWRPATRVDGGWINANAMTLIDVARTEVIATVLLDTPERGAANPWGAAWSANAATLVISHAGTHEVSVIDFAALRAKLASLVPAPPQASGPYGAVASTPAGVSEDLSFLLGLRMRRALPDGDLGPRAVAVIGGHAYAANFFSDSLSVIDLGDPRLGARMIALGPAPQMTAARLGELYFHDARICRGGWQSCASCHPGEGRADALNWDLPNDGLGNPKNTKSLLLAHATPPVMSLGQRQTAESAVRVGVERILFTAQPPEVAESIDVYLKSLKPVPSPYLIGSELSPAARRGERLFHSDATGCADCHPSPLFTDMKSHDVGTRGPEDRASDKFDTPALIELWRTAPYLHDGSVVDLRDLFVFRNQGDRHGITSHLGADEINDLCAYLQSL